MALFARDTNKKTFRPEAGFGKSSGSILVGPSKNARVAAKQNSDAFKDSLNPSASTRIISTKELMKKRLA